MQIAIDGPAGAGKSTIAKIIAEKLGILYLDTGAMYRAVTLGVIENGIDFSSIEAVAHFAETAQICFSEKKVFLNNEDVTEAIRSAEVSAGTSLVASNALVRAILVKRQQEIAGEQSVIMDGRDIGSVVLPKADFKFYLDASIEERAKRRYDEMVAKGDFSDILETIEAAIRQRDYNDRHRKEGPLVCTEDAIVVDTTGKSIESVVEELLKYIKGGFAQ